MLTPGEPAAVHDDSAESRPVPSHELGQRMHNDIRAVLDRPQQDRRRDRVINDQWHAMLVGHVRERFDIADIPRRIADTFAIDRPCLVIDQPGNIISLVRLREADIDSLARQDVSK